MHVYILCHGRNTRAGRHESTQRDRMCCIKVEPVPRKELLPARERDSARSSLVPAKTVGM